MRQIVGVVGDVKSQLEEARHATIFIPLAQDSGEIQGFQAWFPVSIVVRTTRPPLILSHAVETAVHDAEPDLPTGHIQSMEQILSTSLAFQRFLMILMSIFATLALHSRRRGHLRRDVIFCGRNGRMKSAFAWRWARVRADMLANGGAPGNVLAVMGLIIGLAGALRHDETASEELYGVQADRSVVFAIVVVLLAFIAFLACYIPARRAARSGSNRRLALRVMRQSSVLAREAD